MACTPGLNNIQSGGCAPSVTPVFVKRPIDHNPVLMWKAITCVNGQGVVTLYTDKALTQNAAPAFHTSHIVPAPDPDQRRGTNCDEPLFVTVCDAPPSVIPAIAAATCTPGVTRNIDADARAKQVVNAPGTVLEVRVCEASPPLKIEFSELLMHSASTEQTLVRVREYNEVTGLWVIRYENLDGTAFTGAVPTDLVVATAQVQVNERAVIGCGDGVQMLRVTTHIYDKETGVLEGTAISFEDAMGATVAAPTVFAIGDCPPQVRRVLIYLERNGSAVTMADIIAATGSVLVQSVTVKQIAGRGTVRGDSGSGVPLDQGEVWSWSAVTGQDALDTLSASALTMDAGGGEQRITATYFA